MKNKTIKLIKKNKNMLYNCGIKIDEIKIEKLEYTEEAVIVDLVNENSFCRLTAFDSGRLYIQIIDINTEDTIFIYDDIPKTNIRDQFIINSIKKMIKVN